MSFLIEEVCHKDDTDASSILAEFFILINPSFISLRMDAKNNWSILKYEFFGTTISLLIIETSCQILMRKSFKISFETQKNKKLPLWLNLQRKPQYKTQAVKSLAPLV